MAREIFRLEFSRKWNIPVHNFFHRHVYGATRGHMSRPTATALTFLISALAHELVMACITKKVRGYGFVAMMLQLPIVMVQRTKLVRGKKLFNVCSPELPFFLFPHILAPFFRIPYIYSTISAVWFVCHLLSF
jgi:hypothetical protein